MKRSIIAVLLISALVPVVVQGQNPPSPPSGLPAPPTVIHIANGILGGEPAPPPTKFDLDFPGGGPDALVAAIEKAMAKPVNAIVPSDYKDVQIPPLKMREVTLNELFKALQESSPRQVRISRPGMGDQFVNTMYGFQSVGDGASRVWYFRAEKPAEPTPPKEMCRFYQLEPLLEKYKIEDITTAIQTGWSMLHVTKTPQLKFHPETRLLIAVGPEENLKIIESVLEQLGRGQPRFPAPMAVPGMPAPRQ